MLVEREKQRKRKAQMIEKKKKIMTLADIAVLVRLRTCICFKI